jgi:hypothetical protein
MIHGGPRTVTAEEERRREEAWHAASAEVIAQAGERFSQIAQVLRLGPRAGRAFVSAAFEVARPVPDRVHVRETTSVVPGIPTRWRDARARTRFRDTAWAMELTRLRSVVEDDVG